MPGYVYILECADGTYYVGSTTHLEARVREHQEGPFGAAYTRHRRPVKLVWAGEFEHVGLAFAFEKQVQGWRRAKREALIRGDYEKLPSLSWRRVAAEPSEEG
jgi:putative endonuclease